MQLSPHFSYFELTKSDYAMRHGLKNEPPVDILANLRRTAQYMELVREVLSNKPIHITSGYRSPIVNVAVGGTRNSAHCLGYAVDFVCPSFGTPYDVCRRLSTEVPLQYDQLIHEYGSWTHISFDPRGRRQDLSIFNGTGYLNGIIERR